MLLALDHLRREVVEGATQSGTTLIDILIVNTPTKISNLNTTYTQYRREKREEKRNENKGKGTR